ncbi:MAG: vWA domain-containing protein [Phocaeicola sp.]
MRRLPIYLLIDTSKSVEGKSIDAVKAGIESMISTLRTEPFALETVHIGIISYSSQSQQLLPLTSLCEIIIPKLEISTDQTFNIESGLKLLRKQVDLEVRRTTAEKKGDWRPYIFVISNKEILNDYLESELKTFFNFSLIFSCSIQENGLTSKIILQEKNPLDYPLYEEKGSSTVELFRSISNKLVQYPPLGHRDYIWSQTE